MAPKRCFSPAHKKIHLFLYHGTMPLANKPETGYDRMDCPACHREHLGHDGWNSHTASATISTCCATVTMARSATTAETQSRVVVVRPRGVLAGCVRRLYTLPRAYINDSPADLGNLSIGVS